MDPTQLTGEIETLLEGIIAWAVVAVPNLISALVLLIAGWWLAGRAAITLRRIIDNHVDATLCTVIVSLVRYAILVLVVIAVLGQVGIQTTSVLAALGAVGLAIGLAMQGTLSNIAAGVMLLWLRPFRVGDYIDTGNVAGTVKEVTLFACELHSWDGVYQFVPNSELWNKRIINYSRLPTRMVDLSFRVAYGDDLEKGRDVLTQLAGDARVHRDPAPQIFVNELSDSAVVLALRVWTANGDYWPVRRELTESGKAALEAAGLSIPFPQRDLHLRHAPEAAPRPA